MANIRYSLTRIVALCTVILLSISMPKLLIADSDTIRYDYSKLDLEVILTDLDNCLDSRSKYQESYKQRLYALKELLNATEDSEAKFNIYDLLCNSYKPFNCDSALHYAELQISEAKSLNRIDLISTAQLQLLNSYILKGLYREGRELAIQIRPNITSKEHLASYYGNMGALYRYKESYNGGATFSSNNINQNRYRDSLIIVTSNNSLTNIISSGEKLYLEGKTESAKNLLATELLKYKNISDRSVGYIGYTLSLFYNKKEDIEKRKIFLALSAYSDISNGIREYIALRELAILLHDVGDIERSNRYIDIAMEDAIDSHAQLRTVEVSRMLPLISKAYKAFINKRDSNKLIFIWVVISLSLALSIAMFIIYRQKSRLIKAHKREVNINAQLKRVNIELEASNLETRIANEGLHRAVILQEKYLALFLQLCSDYIKNLESYQTKILSEARKPNRDALIRMLKSDDLANRERKELYVNFDKAFLTLHPNFITHFNKLLADDQQIEINKSDSLNTELRIFALIRLGVTDSNKIALFLRYSLTTIYNYRTRVRNRSKGDRSLFEIEVGKIK